MKKAIDTIKSFFEKNDWKYNFNDEDIELIGWWLYERRDNPELKMYIDKKEVPTETIEDIWNLL